MMLLSEIAQSCIGTVQGANCSITGVSTDTRAIQPGNLFVALRGHQFDGHQFASKAEKSGAQALLVDHVVKGVALPQIVVRDTTLALGQIGRACREQFEGVVIGITGSGGKTTVKGMLNQILQQQGQTLSSFGNFNNHIGVPLTLLKMAKQAFAVVEMGTNHPGEIGYLTSLVQPDIALVNNVMPAHIGGFGSLEAIAQEKSTVYGTLQAQQCAVINADDDFAEYFIDKTKHCQQMMFSRKQMPSSCNGLLAENIHADSSGCYRFQLRYDHESVDVALAVLGDHMVSNALAAAACATVAGCSLQVVSLGLAKFRGEKGRMQAQAGIGGCCVVDDTYNANPGSVKAAIDYLASRPGQRILVLGDLGELGEEAQSAHIQIGEYAKKMSIDALYTVGEAAALAANRFGESGVSFDNKDDLAVDLVHRLNDQTTVLVKGSRSAKMEEVCSKLLDNGENKSC